MNRTTGEKFDIREEIRLIPKTMIAVSVLGFFLIQSLLIILAFRHDPQAPPMAVRVLVGTLAGSVLAFFLLLVGYVNRDAKRRGMNHVLWTVLVLVIPNAIGYILYFVLRQPIVGTCPNCGATVRASFNFCPNCRFNVRPACPQCHRTIELGTTFCPYCSAELKGVA